MQPTEGYMKKASLHFEQGRSFFYGLDEICRGFIAWVCRGLWEATLQVVARELIPSGGPDLGRNLGDRIGDRLS
ncbi:MAG: hypothetical protein H6Q76_2473 [Firmicutes bacterium]|nr:hypothetical protein [Bacillota bacterium]